MMKLIKSLLFCSTSLFGLHSLAADINQPVHLPNKAVNKINQVRLQGLVAKDENQQLVEDELNKSGINKIEQFGCNLNVGNTVSSNSLLSGDRDVIITGDVINFCK